MKRFALNSRVFCIYRLNLYGSFFVFAGKAAQILGKAFFKPQISFRKPAAYVLIINIILFHFLHSFHINQKRCICKNNICSVISLVYNMFLNIRKAVLFTPNPLLNQHQLIPQQIRLNSFAYFSLNVSVLLPIFQLAAASSIMRIPDFFSNALTIARRCR